MNTDKLALDAQKQAREAIKYWNSSYADGCPHPLGVAALNALEISIAALEAVQVEPVADRVVDRAWTQFCAAIGDSPKAPYPGMIKAFENYYAQSFADKDWRNEASVWAAAWKAALYATPQEAQTSWIPVSEKLPLEDGRYICATWLHMDMTQHVEAVSYRSGSGLFDDANVTHWMPLPAAPKA